MEFLCSQDLFDLTESCSLQPAFGMEHIKTNESISRSPELTLLTETGCSIFGDMTSKFRLFTKKRFIGFQYLSTEIGFNNAKINFL